MASFWTHESTGLKRVTHFSFVSFARSRIPHHTWIWYTTRAPSEQIWSPGHRRNTQANELGTRAIVKLSETLKPSFGIIRSRPLYDGGEGGRVREFRVRMNTQTRQSYNATVRSTSHYSGSLTAVKGCSGASASRSLHPAHPLSRLSRERFVPGLCQ